jgi:hypothetical protein
MVPAFAGDEPLCVPEPVGEMYKMAMGTPYSENKLDVSGRTAFSRSSAEIPQAKTIALPEPISSRLKARPCDPLSVFPHAGAD